MIQRMRFADVSDNELPGTLKKLIEGLSEGDQIILVEGSNWDYAASDPEGVVIKEEEKWSVNGVRPCDAPIDPNKHSTPYPVTMEKRMINGNGPAVLTAFHQYQGHPYGVLFELSDGTLMLVVYDHSKKRVVTTIE